ncbi:hypothetical protein CL657_00060 [bacterium]|nr:hypothetical protein [bacterium]
MIHQTIVIIPSYNENNTAILLDQIKAFKHHHSNYSFLIIDDGCSKIKPYHDSIKAAGHYLIVNEKNLGKAKSIHIGVYEAIKYSPDFIVFMDADLSVSLNQLTELTKKFNQGADLVIGSRKSNQSKITKSQHFFRKNMGNIFNILCKLLVLKNINDTQCGFKGFRCHIAKDIFSKQIIFDFSFDVELLTLACIAQHKLSIIPVTWINDPNSNVNFIKDSLSMFFSLLKIKYYYQLKTPLYYKNIL